MTEEKKEKLGKELNSKKTEIAEIKDNLNDLDESKEKWFEEKESVQKRISELITKVKELKKERNALTEKVKEGKTKRQELNKEINEKIAEIKEISKDVKEPVEPRSYKDNPRRLKEEIQKLEYAIETQGFSFAKEQKVMKEIKDKKKKLAEVEKVSGSWIKQNNLSREIDRLKRAANKLHREITDKATMSQKKHEEMLKVSAEIDELKKKEEEYQNKFLDYKKQFNESNKDLKEKLGEISAVNTKMKQKKVENAKQKKKKDEEMLKNKEIAVEDKIKKKVKLTTEDLLVFQRKNSE